MASIMPRQFSHAEGLDASHAQVTLIEVARLSHAESIGVTGVHKKPVALLSFFLHSFFLLSSMAVAPLVILEFLAPYKVHGALNCLYELVS
jgi:hypothetical protein